MGPPGAEAKRAPRVEASFEAYPASVHLGLPFQAVLRIAASEDAPDVTVEILTSPDVVVVGGTAHWSGALLAGEVQDLPVTVLLVGSGEYSLGARVTDRGPAGVVVSGTTVSVLATGGVAALSDEPHVAIRLRATGPAGLPIAEPLPGPPVPASGSEALVSAGVVSGTAQWTDPEGHRHPIRGALVQVYGGAPGSTLLAETFTDLAGSYAVGVVSPAGVVSVRVFSQDGFNGAFATIFPSGASGSRYALQVGPVPLAGSVTLNLTGDRPVRGTPGSPSTDTGTMLASRAFSVYDAMLTFWFQATALIGHNMQAGVAAFPVGGGVSFYSPSTQRMSILRADAFDWDVLGHEFFHFTTDRGASRNIDDNPGGAHSGGTAIGQAGRGRDAGMRLAWSEGVATFMSVSLQRAPVPSVVPFPTSLANSGDATYQDTEDLLISSPLEGPARNDGFGSENSVMAVLWDLSDTLADSNGSVSDTFGGATAKLVWDAIDHLLPCDPCTRVDRFWEGITALFGRYSAASFAVAPLFVLNKMAPMATAPADGAALAGGLRPTFRWVPNGDPSAAHRNNHFFLVFSRDGFRNHRVSIEVPTLGATSYTPTEAEWNQVFQGGQTNARYQWFVMAERADAPAVPATWYWYSNLMSFTARSLHIRITWNNLGADVDLHLTPPSGEDIAYYNTAPGWGNLDRDCISSCTVENISVAYFPATGTYEAWAHYYSDHDRGAATVRAEVFNAGARIIDRTFTLGGTGDRATIFRVFLPRSGVAEVVPDGVPGARRLDPIGLPPKRAPNR